MVNRQNNVRLTFRICHARTNNIKPALRHNLIIHQMWRQISQDNILIHQVAQFTNFDDFVYCLGRQRGIVITSPTKTILFMFHGFTTPNADLIKTHVNCLNSAGRFNYFLLYETYSVVYQDTALHVLVQKQDRYGYVDQTDFGLRPLA